MDLTYTRTSGSSPTYQQKNIAGAEAESELYAYDTLHRLTNVKRGELSFPDNVPTVASPAREQTWTLDTLGNWQNPSGLAIDTNDSGSAGAPSDARTHTVVLATSFLAGVQALYVVLADQRVGPRTTSNPGLTWWLHAL